MTTQRFKVRQLETNEEVSGELEVDSNLVDQPTAALCFDYLQTAADNDPTLTAEQATMLRFSPSTDQYDEPQPTEEDPIKKIIPCLLNYAKDFERKIKKDPLIKTETDKIVASCVRNVQEGADHTDSGGGVTFDTQQVWSIIKEVFEALLANIPSASAGTLLVYLGNGLAYSYYLLKRLVSKYIEHITFRSVAGIMFSVVSFLLKYLIKIKFKTILQNLGGWQMLGNAVVNTGIDAAVDTVSYHISNGPIEYIAWGVAIVAVATAVYLRITRR